MYWHVDDSGHRVFVDSLVIQYNNTADILISEHHFKRSLVNCVTKEFDSYSKAMRYLSRNPDLPKRQQELWEQAGNHKPFVAYLANPDDNVIFSVNILPAGIKISLSTYKFHDNKITKEKQSVSSEYLKRYSDVIYITLADAVRGLLAGRKSALEKEESCWDSYIKAFENGV